jgi:hypothetical protein
MANEATLQFETGVAIPFTVADGTAVPKGTLLKITDPMTAIITSAAGDALAGIAGEAKIASDGNTKLAVYMEGIFRMTAGGSIAVGDSVMSETGGTNEVLTATSAKEGREILGTSLEAAGDGETFLVHVNIGGGSPNA